LTPSEIPKKEETYHKRMKNIKTTIMKRSTSNLREKKMVNRRSLCKESLTHAREMADQARRRSVEGPIFV
jgi:hypothetical protein